MEELKACPYCKGYESAGFEGKNGKLQMFNFCPVCGKPFNEAGKKILADRHAAPENKALTLEELLNAIRNISYGSPEFRDSNGCTDSLVVNFYKAILGEAVKEAFAYARKAERSKSNA